MSKKSKKNKKIVSNKVTDQTGFSKSDWYGPSRKSRNNKNHGKNKSKYNKSPRSSSPDDVNSVENSTKYSENSVDYRPNLPQ